jgi:prophage regulatory protein
MTHLIRSSSQEAEKATGFRKSARAKKVIEGLLPPPIKLGGKARAFVAHELEAVTAARATGANDDEVREVVQKLIAARACHPKKTQELGK